MNHTLEIIRQANALPTVLESLREILELEGEEIDRNFYGTSEIEREVFNKARQAVKLGEEASKPIMPEAELAITQLRNSTRRMDAQIARITKENLILAVKALLMHSACPMGHEKAERWTNACETARKILAQAEKEGAQ